MLKKLLAFSLVATVALSPSLVSGAGNDELYRPAKLPEFESAKTLAEIPVTPVKITWIPEGSPQDQTLKTMEAAAPPQVSDPGGWQSRGKYPGQVNTGSGFTFVPAASGTNWLSGGGDFKVELTGVDGAFTAQLMEYDPDTDDKVGENIRITGNGTLLYEGISQFVDGAEAEFYLSMTQGYTSEVIYAEGFD